MNKDRTDGGLRWGVEPVCEALTMYGVRIAPSSYYESISHRPSARELQDARLKPHIERVHARSGATFGPRRVWEELNGEGLRVARCTVERLMAEMSLRGRPRGRPPLRRAPVEPEVPVPWLFSDHVPVS